METGLFIAGVVAGAVIGGFATLVWAQWILNQRDKF